MTIKIKQFFNYKFKTMAKQTAKANLSTNAVQIERNSIITGSKVFRALNHDLRLKIIKMINDKNEVNVNVIYGTLKIEQSVASQHLKILRDADLLKSRRESKKIYYSLNEFRLKQVDAALDVLLKVASPV